MPPWLAPLLFVEKTSTAQCKSSALTWHGQEKMLCVSASQTETLFPWPHAVGCSPLQLRSVNSGLWGRMGVAEQQTATVCQLRGFDRDQRH